MKKGRYRQTYDDVLRGAEVCPGCDGPKARTSGLCEPCRKAIKRGTPGSTALREICPDCGGPKHEEALVCRDCRGALERGRSPRGNHRGRVPEGLHTIGRAESIITFRNVETGELRTRLCVGENAPAQVEAGRRSLPEGEWEVSSRSTPLSILNDLQRQA